MNRPIDTRTPAEIAEEEAREAHHDADEYAVRLARFQNYRDMEHHAERVLWKKYAHTAIDRAIKAARWAQHARDCAVFHDEPCEGETLCMVGDRLRREYEGARDGE